MSATARRGDAPRPWTRPDPAALAPLLLTALVLAAGLVPLPAGRLKALRLSARSLEPNRADREATAGSYYEGLIDGGPADQRGELARRLLGESPDWVRFHDIHAHRDLPGDFLQFRLEPRIDRVVFGARFTTGARGLRDRDYPRRKPDGTFRVVLLGSSIDMGWGVGTDQTYENLLEDWLNRRAARQGLSRRFEVINLAVAAYGPLQRLESYRRLGPSYEPDLVLYSATMLDPRLLEGHLTTLLRDRIGPEYGFLRDDLARAGLTADDLALGPDGGLAHRDRVKKKLRPLVWPIIDDTLAALRAECDGAGVPLAYLVIPRVGKSDAPDARAEPVARHAAVAARHARWLIDLSAAFDDREQAKLEIAPWDDHPNARGHDLLFRALAKAIADDPTLYRALFGADPRD